MYKLLSFLCIAIIGLIFFASNPRVVFALCVGDKTFSLNNCHINCQGPPTVYALTYEVYDCPPGSPPDPDNPGKKLCTDDAARQNPAKCSYNFWYDNPACTGNQVANQCATWCSKNGTVPCGPGVEGCKCGVSAVCIDNTQNYTPTYMCTNDPNSYQSTHGGCTGVSCGYFCSGANTSCYEKYASQGLTQFEMASYSGSGQQSLAQCQAYSAAGCGDLPTPTPVPPTATPTPTSAAGVCPGGTNNCGNNNYGQLGSCAGSWSWPANSQWDSWCQANAPGPKDYCYTCNVAPTSPPPPSSCSSPPCNKHNSSCEQVPNCCAAGSYEYVPAPGDAEYAGAHYHYQFVYCAPTSPPPTATPTPTPTPIPYTISGNVFRDDNKNNIKNGAETNYSSGTTTIRFVNTGTGAQTTVNTGNGTYTSGLTLVAGTYRVEYTTLPTNYLMTYPVNGPPPFFTVTVGGSCSVGSHNTATCSGGSITNLNFGITNSFAWLQCVGGSCRNDGGFQNSIPSSAVAACGGANAAISRGTSNTPGIIYSGDSSYTFGSGQASPNPYNWIAGGLSYPDSFNPINTGVIRTSYDYYITTLRQSGATVTDLTSTHCGAGGIANCRLDTAVLSNGIYRANGNLTLTSLSGTYTFPGVKNFVFLVNGTLRIETNVRVPVGSTATFSVKDDILIDRNVGESDFTSYTPNVEGYYSADDSFIIEGNNSCTLGVDKRFNLGGAVVVNAGRAGGTFQNNRDLCAGNLQCPAIALIERVDFLLNSPQFIKSPTYIWQEVAP